MKDTAFLKNTYFARRGIYDNKRIYENTISSYNRAVKYKIGIELDIRLLKDGTIICFHDDDMMRLLHMEGKIDNLTYDELCYLSKFQIPRLEDALNAINGNVPIIIQIKEKYRKNSLEIKLCKLLDNYKGNFAIESFHIKPLKWFNKNRPNFIIGYMIGWKNFRKDTFFKKYDFICIKINTYKPLILKKYKEKKIVIGWRVNKREDFDINKNFYDTLICDNVLEIFNDK